MKELKFKYWKDGNFWVGYLELYPDYWNDYDMIFPVSDLRQGQIS
jgi:hypothetical protein